MSSAKPLMFTEQVVSDTPVTSFDLSHELKTSLDPGNLVPILVEDVLPSDIFKMNVNSFLRLAPMTFPVFQRIDCYVHAFFIPNRIVWDKWNEFIWNGDGKVRMKDQSDYVPPVPPYFVLNSDSFTELTNLLRETFGVSSGAFGLSVMLSSYLFTGYSFYDELMGRVDFANSQRIVPLMRKVYNDYTIGSKPLTAYLGITKSVDYVTAVANCLIYASTLTGDVSTNLVQLFASPIGTGTDFLTNLVYASPSDATDTFDNTGYYPWLDPEGLPYVQALVDTSFSLSSNHDIYYDVAGYVKDSFKVIKGDIVNFISAGGSLTFQYQSENYETSAVSTITKTVTIDGDSLPYLRKTCEVLSLFQNVGSSNAFRFDVQILRAYQMVYNEYYRDENSDPYFEFSTGSGLVHWNALLPMCWTRTRAFEHDYFTSCFPQQSRENYLLPVGLKFQSNNGAVVSTDGDSFSVNTNSSGIAKVTAKVTGLLDDLRTMMHLQELADKVSRAGSRVRESIQSLFPNTDIQDISPDQPVYIAGSNFPVTISEVTQTSASDAQSALGDYAGHGIATGCDLNFDWKCREHGFIVVLASIRPRTGYHQGLAKMFDRRTYLDYALPDLATLGEQPVLNKEIFSGSSDPNGTFGYIPRYSEYKYRADTLSGDFLNPWTMSAWHLSRTFFTQPLLNSEFLHIDSKENDRIFAYEDDDLDHYFGVFYFNETAVRPLPMYANPTF